jgi:hypothetical protein
MVHPTLVFFPGTPTPHGMSIVRGGRTVELTDSASENSKHSEGGI